MCPEDLLCCESWNQALISGHLIQINLTHFYSLVTCISCRDIPWWHAYPAGIFRGGMHILQGYSMVACISCRDIPWWHAYPAGISLIEGSNTDPQI